MTTLKQSVYEREQTPISFDEIMKVLKPHHADPNFILLDDLKDNPSDDDLFKGKDCCLILCTLHTHGHSTNINHWISLIKSGNEYWYYDSLANSLAKLTARLANGKRSLVNWAEGKRVKQNKVRTQRHDSSINTCVCHQAVRLVRKDLNPIKFIRWLTHANLEPDIAVSYLCYIDLLKN